MEELKIGEKIFLSSRRTGQVLGYTNDYVGKLCREGCLDAKMVGRTWYVDFDSVKKYSTLVAIEKEERRKELSETFSKEYQEYGLLKSEDVKVGAIEVVSTPVEVAPIEALVETEVYEISGVSVPSKYIHHGYLKIAVTGAFAIVLFVAGIFGFQNKEKIFSNTLESTNSSEISFAKTLKNLGGEATAFFALENSSEEKKENVEISTKQKINFISDFQKFYQPLFFRVSEIYSSVGGVVLGFGETVRVALNSTGSTWIASYEKVGESTVSLASANVSFGDFEMPRFGSFNGQQFFSNSKTAFSVPGTFWLRGFERTGEGMLLVLNSVPLEFVDTLSENTGKKLAMFFAQRPQTEIALEKNEERDFLLDFPEAVTDSADSLIEEIPNSYDRLAIATPVSFWGKMIDTLSDPLVSLFYKEPAQVLVVDKDVNVVEENTYVTEVTPTAPTSVVLNERVKETTIIREGNTELLRSELNKMRAEYLNLSESLLSIITTKRSFDALQVDRIYNSVEKSNRGGSSGTVDLTTIDGSTITNSTFSGSATLSSLSVTGSGTSTFAGGISTNLLNVTSTTASSTFANGINLTGGCFSINGVCISGSGAGGAGTVTSVALTVPTGLAVSGSPVTTSGTLAITFDAGYGIPLTASTTAWNNFYNTPSTQITAGTGLSWTGNTLSSSFTSSQWTTTGSNIYYTTGNVGIGTTDPGSAELAVVGQIGVNTTNPSADLHVNNNTGSASFTLSSSASASTQITLDDSGATDVYLTSTNGIFDVWTGGNNKRFTIDASGNIGIGTTSPYAKLSVKGSSDLGNSALAGYFIATTTASSTFAGGIRTNLLNVTSTSASSTFANGINLTGGCFSINGVCITSGGTGTLTGTGVAGMMSAWSSSGNLIATSTIIGERFIATSTTATSTFAGGLVAGTSGLNVLQNGNVGIGTAAPTQKLEVTGNIYASNLIYTPAISIGTSLFGTPTFRASGNRFIGYNAGVADISFAMSPTANDSTGANSTVLLSTNAASYFNGGNVGIGTTSPYAKLSVAGEVVARNFISTSTTASVFPFASTTALTVGGTFWGAGLSECADAGDKIIWNNGSFSCGADAGAGGGITALGAQYSSFQNGASQTFATSSDTNIGLTITSSGDIHTFTPSWSGNLSVARGGTGLTTFGGTNTILYTSSADTLTSSGNFLFTGTNLGIGTSTPGTALSVVGPGVFTDQVTATNFYATSTTATSTFAGGLTVGSTLYVSQNGKIGVGTANPTGVFHINSGTNEHQLTLSGSLNAAGETAGVEFKYAGGISGDGNIARILGYTQSGGGGDILFQTAAGGTSSYLTQMTLSRAGNLGVGTSTPGTKLSVTGAGVFTDRLTATHFYATSTTATSTFLGGLQTALLNVTSATASSTFANGIDLTSGCFSINGVCITSGGGGNLTGNGIAGMMSAWSSSTGLIATSTIIGEQFIATSTTATSTFLGGLAVDGTTLVVDYSSNEVGVGTASPLAKLDVQGTIRSSGATANDFITIGGSTNQTITVSSNTLGAHYQFIGDTTGSGGPAELRFGSGAGITWRSTTRADSGSNDLGIYRGAANKLYIGTGTSGDFSGTLIAGNVGIGTTSPYAKLSVEGSSALGNSALAGYFIATSTISTSTFAGGATFATGGGSVGIGTTTPVALLSLSGGTTANLGINLGDAAANLYRSAASTIRTDATLNVAGASTISQFGIFSGNGARLGGSRIDISASSGSAMIIGGSYNMQWTNGDFYYNTVDTNFSRYGAGVLAVGNGTLGNTSGTLLVGNLGVGTTSPYAKLSVVGEVVASHFTATTTASSTFAGGISTNLLNVTSTSASSTFANGINLTSGCFAVNGVCVGTGTGSGTLTGNGIAGMMSAWSSSTGLIATSTIIGEQFIATSTTATSTFAGGFSAGSSLYVLQGGNVGIGRSNPSSVLDINGNITIGTASNPVNRSTISSNGAGTLVLNATNIGGVSVYGTLSPASLGTDFGTTALRWDAFLRDVDISGNLGVGTTSPYAKLSVAGQIVANNIWATSTTESNYFGGSVGIGTTAPGAELDIQNSGSAFQINPTGAQINFQTQGSGGQQLVFAPKTNIAASPTASFVIGSGFVNVGSSLNQYGTNTFGVAGQSYFNDSVGIGTTSPYAKLSVVGEVVASHFTATTTASSTFAGGISTNLLNVTSSTASSTFANGINLTAGCFSINGSCITAGGSGTLTGTGIAGMMSAWSSSTGLIATSTIIGERFIATSTTSTSTFLGGATFATGGGNVGVGTASPTDKFQVVGIISSGVPNSSSGELRMYQGGGSAYASLKDDVATTRIGLYRSNTNDFFTSYNTATGDTEINSTFAGSNILFQYQRGELGRFTSSGNFGIGTSSPYAKLSVKGSSDLGNSALAGYFIATTTASSTFAGGISTNLLNVTSTTASSTFANGINLTGGCFAVNGSCMTLNGSEWATFYNTPSTRITAGSNLSWSGNTLNASLSTSSINYLRLVNGGLETGTTTDFLRAAYFVATSTTATSTFAGVVTVNGNMGIGTTIPTAKLQVIGDFKIGDYISYAKIGVGGTSTQMNYHGFEDWLVTDTTSSPNLGYASFDARPELIGSGINGHLVGLQSRPIYNSSGDLTDYFDAINAAAVHNGAGTVSNANALKITDIGGTGPVSNNYGIYIGNISRGSVDNYSIYSNGGKSYFKGRVGVGTTTPGSWLHVAGSDSSTSAVTAELTGSGANKLVVYPFNDGNVYLQHNGKAVFSPVGSITPQLTIDTTGFVGVGTLSPLSKMAVVGSSATVGGGAATAGIFHVTTGTGDATSNRLMMGVVDGSYSWIQASQPGTAWRNLALQPGGGSVGIGTTSPYSLLSLKGSSVVDPLLNIFAYDNSQVLEITASGMFKYGEKLDQSTSGPYVSFKTGRLNGYVGGDYMLIDPLSVSSGNILNIQEGGAHRFVVQGVTGNVGIGTTSPYAKLSVGGEVVAGFFTATTTATSTLAGGLKTNLLNVTSATASSTFANGINLTGGCFSINGSCITGGGGSGSGTVSSGLIGQFPYYAGSGTTLTATSSVFLATNGNFGVGTTSPFADFSIHANANELYRSTIFSIASSTASATSTLFTVLATGNVGVGTTTPSARFSVFGDSYFDGALTFASTTATTTIRGGLSVGGGAFQYDWSTGITSIDNAELGALSFADDGGILSWTDMNVTSSASAGTVESYSALLDNLPAITVFGESNGVGGIRSLRVGIGTTTPNAALSVVGSTTSQTIFAVASSTSSDTFFVINNAGNVGIGTTSPYSKLSVVGTVVAADFVATSSTLGFKAANLLGGATNLTVDANGNIIRDPSDLNLKENVETLEGALDKIVQLRGVSYEWKDKDRFGSSTEIGVIAQEVELVVPEVVSSGGPYKSVNIKNLVALLIEGVKELKIKFDEIAVWFTDGKFRVQNDVCVDDVCVSKEQFKALLLNAGGVAPTPEPTPDSPDETSGGDDEGGSATTTDSTSGGDETATGDTTSGGGDTTTTDSTGDSGATDSSSGTTDSTSGGGEASSEDSSSPSDSSGGESGGASI